MSRSSTTFKKGEGGRPKGTVNRKVKVGIEYAQSYLKDPDFQDAVRLILANPHHDLFMRVFELVMSYAYGKPTEHVHQTSDGTVISNTYIERLTIAREMLEYRANASSDVTSGRPELFAGHSD